jgi:hypothetical protein
LCKARESGRWSKSERASSVTANNSRSVYALDATTTDLCLALFPWAQFRKHKGAVKLHTLPG